MEALPKNKIKSFVLKNKWVIIAAIFFIAWKFLLIGVLWHDRTIPPEPDDLLIYSGYINSAKICPRLLCNYPLINFSDSSGTSYLSYRIIGGVIAKIFNIDPAHLLQASFYLGTIVLLYTLILVLRPLFKKQLELTYCLIFLAIYHGSGSYHGFFWVVPSFFAVLLFFLVFRQWVLNKPTPLILPVLTLAIYLYMHPLSFFALFCFLFFAIIHWLLSRPSSFVYLKRVAILILTAMALYAPALIIVEKSNPTVKSSQIYAARTLFNNLPSLLISLVDSKNQEEPAEEDLDDDTDLSQLTCDAGINPPLAINAPAQPPPTSDISLAPSTTPTPSPPALPPQIQSPECDLSATVSFKQNLASIFPGATGIYDSYFRFLTINPIITIIFVSMLVLLAYRRRFVVLSLYSGTLIFIMLSVLTRYGYRSVVFLWPITYIVFAIAIYDFFDIVIKIPNRAAKNAISFLAYILVIGFVLLNMVYSLFWNQQMNNSNKYNITNDFTSYLLSILEPEQLLASGSKTITSYMLNTELIHFGLTNENSVAAYYIVLYNPSVETSVSDSNLNSFFDRFTALLNLERQATKCSAPIPPIPDGYELLKTFGDVYLYRNTAIVNLE